MSKPDATNVTEVVKFINKLLGSYWGAYAQHRMHVALLDAWGVTGLARSMESHINDEPGTITRLSSRLLDLGGEPSFAIAVPNIGRTLQEILQNDLDVHRARPALNTAAEVAAAAHDATSRVMFEAILAEEEKHLTWLDTELKLLDQLGEPLYVANRLHQTYEAPAV
jgi:bacterioferritin